NEGRQGLIGCTGDTVYGQRILGIVDAGVDAREGQQLQYGDASQRQEEGLPDMCAQQMPVESSPRLPQMRPDAGRDDDRRDQLSQKPAGNPKPPSGGNGDQAGYGPHDNEPAIVGKVSPHAYAAGVEACPE